MRNDQREISSIEDLLDHVDEATRERDSVSLEDILALVGRRSFGPLLLVAGLATLAPLVGDIPGVPTVIGAFVFLMSIQLLVGHKYFWLPGWLLHRSMDKTRLCRALGWMRRPARFVDRFLRPRLTMFAEGAAIYVIAGAACLIAAAMPVMEVVPFSANAAGAALTIFGLAMIARDGVLALIAFVLTAVTAGIAIYNLV